MPGERTALMDALGPRQLEPDAWHRWIAEALALLLRRPGRWILWTAGILLLAWIAQQSRWDWFRQAALLFLAPISLTVFVRIALYADYGQPAQSGDFLPDNRDCMLALGLAAVVFTLLGVFAASWQPAVAAFQNLLIEYGLYEPVSPEGLPAPPLLAQALLGPVLILGGLMGLALVAVLSLMLLFGQWFLLPMLVLHRPPVAPAFAASIQGCRLNPVPVSGMLGVLLIGLAAVLLSLGWLAPVMLPYFGALLYVAYRDVFLGRSENQPVRVDEPAPAGFA